METVWLGSRECADPRISGGKASALSRLRAAAPVPDGFAVTAGAHRRRPSTAELHAIVEPAYRELARLTGLETPAVAVRSSGLDEDGASSSFAGQHETLLNVRGAAAVTEAVLACWLSGSSDRARAYRNAQGLGAEPAMAVLVQQMVVADEAGVAFTADPVSGDREVVVINASFGLGESVVAGTVTPDTYVIAREGLQVRERVIAAKERMTILAEAGVREVPVPTLLRSEPSLDDRRAAEVAALALRLETLEGLPVDIEFAYADGILHLLQCRPITTLGAHHG